MGDKAKILTFQPLFIADCEEPQKELEKIAQDRKITPALLEVKLQEVFYFLKSEGKPHFEELKESELGFLEDEEFLSRPDVEIRQRFAIIIEPQKERKYSFSLRLGEDFRELFLTLHKGSQITYNAVFLEELFERVRAQKAIMRVLFRQEAKERERIASLLKELQNLPFLDKDYEILLAQSAGGGRCVEATLILHFQEDPALQGRFPTIKGGMLLATFLKPQKGGAGRDCLGNYIPPKEPSASAQNPLRIDESIEERDEGDKINYYAKESGYLLFEEYRLSIAQKIEVEEVDLKTTGSLLGGLDAPTSVVVKENHYLKEALGDGAKIEAGEVEIAGNIGSGSEIKANRVTISGQTHQTSKIHAQSASIEAHKGWVEADEVKVMRLEAGIIRAQKVHIEHAHGGKVYAKEISIRFLHSNLQAFASEKIEIFEIMGEDNKFTLTPEANPKIQSRLATLLRSFEELSAALKTKIKKFNEEAKEIKALRPLATKIKAMIDLNRQEGVGTPAYLQEKLKSYINLLKYTQAHKEEIEKLQGERHALSEEILSLQAPTLASYIWSKNGWKGYNEVRFKLLLPPKDLFIAPKTSIHHGLLRLDEHQQSILNQKGVP